MKEAKRQWLSFISLVLEVNPFEEWQSACFVIERLKLSTPGIICQNGSSYGMLGGNLWCVSTERKPPDYLLPNPSPWASHGTECGCSSPCLPRCHVAPFSPRQGSRRLAGLVHLQMVQIQLLPSCGFWILLHSEGSQGVISWLTPSPW